MKKLTLSFLASIFVLLVLWLLANQNSLRAFRQELPAYYAQTFCMCTYLQELEAPHCQTQLHKPWLLKITQLKQDKQQKKVTAHFLGASATSLFVNEQQGCQLK